MRFVYSILRQLVEKDIRSIVRTAGDEKICGELIDDINAGRVLCMDLMKGPDRIGSLVFELRHPAVIIHALYSNPNERGVTEHAVQACKDIAKANGCQSLILGTKRPGLVEKLLAHGFRVSQVELTFPL